MTSVQDPRYWPDDESVPARRTYTGAESDRMMKLSREGCASDEAMPLARRDAAGFHLCFACERSVVKTAEGWVHAKWGGSGWPFRRRVRIVLMLRRRVEGRTRNMHVASARADHSGAGR